MEIAVKMLLAHDLLPHVELKETDRKKVQKALAQAKGQLQEAKESITNLITAIQKGVDALSVQTALREAEAREKALLKDIEAFETELLSVDSRKATQGNLQESIKALHKAMTEGDREQMRGRLRYALSRSVDRITLHDTKDERTMKLEIGKQVRHIDFDRKELVFRFRESEDIWGTCEVPYTNGDRKRIIP